MACLWCIPLKSASYEHIVSGVLQPFKRSVHSCRGLELQPHLLSPHYTMFCGQIHAPATLPNYVLMHLMNTKFLASLYSSKPRLFFFYAKQLTPWPSFPSEERFSPPAQFVHRSISSTHCNVKPHSLCQALLLQEFCL